MGKKLTIDDFIERSNKIHNNEYDYSEVKYVGTHFKIKIICKIHGIFDQTPSSHFNGRGCPSCYGTPRKKQKDFIKECSKIHNNKYDYSLVEYKNRHAKIKIVCKIHGIFEQTSRSHLRGNGCPHCAGLFKYNKESFIRKSHLIHYNKYDYSLIDYINLKSKIKIICNTHGIFEQIPSDHLCGSGCPSCSNKFRHNNDTFIKKSIEVHGIKYDYSLVKYKNNKSKIKLICPDHGIFETRPDNHLNSKNGCPKCSESQGEKLTSNLLNTMNIKFEREKKFKKCKNINILSFDFYLPDHNICIEYDGKQHFESINHFGGDISYDNQIIKDNIKNKYCEDNNIKLIRIRYDDNIEERLLEIKNSESSEFPEFR